MQTRKSAFQLTKTILEVTNVYVLTPVFALFC